MKNLYTGNLLLVIGVVVPMLILLMFTHEPSRKEKKQSVQPKVEEPSESSKLMDIQKRLNEHREGIQEANKAASKQVKKIQRDLATKDKLKPLAEPEATPTAAPVDSEQARLAKQKQETIEWQRQQWSQAMGKGSTVFGATSTTGNSQGYSGNRSYSSPYSSSYGSSSYSDYRRQNRYQTRY